MEQTLQDKERMAKLEHALMQFSNALADVIHNNTSYTLTYLDRSYSTAKINSATMEIGSVRVLFRENEWDVIMPSEGNPVNQKLMEEWDRQTIDSDIEYHKKRIDRLEQIKQELNNKKQ